MAWRCRLDLPDRRGRWATPSCRCSVPATGPAPHPCGRRRGCYGQPRRWLSAAADGEVEVDAYDSGDFGGGGAEAGSGGGIDAAADSDDLYDEAGADSLMAEAGSEEEYSDGDDEYEDVDGDEGQPGDPWQLGPDDDGAPSRRRAVRNLCPRRHRGERKGFKHIWPAGKTDPDGGARLPARGRGGVKRDAPSCRL